jgi:signal transduction histidine kinase
VPICVFCVYLWHSHCSLSIHPRLPTFRYDNRTMTESPPPHQPPPPGRLADDPAFAAAVAAAKREALYQFAYGLSHEINNPLANIASRAQTLLIDERDPERRRKLATINQQAFRAHEMIADLMLYARPPEPVLAAADLVQIAGQIAAEMQPLAVEQGTTLVLEAAADQFVIQADATQMGVALKALVQNALEALRVGGRVQIGVRAEPTFVVVSVADSGPGIPAEHLPHLFDPFFSGREAGRGLGLGLCKAWRIAELHRGSIQVDLPPTGGAIFSLRLPRS